MSQLTSLSPEVLIPRLGETLTSRGLITQAQLKNALAYQSSQRKDGRVVRLGEAIVELGYMTRKVLDGTITEQIIALRNALEDANRNLEKRVEMRTAELQSALARLSELNELKTNIISNVSHELRTPLTHIKGYLELLFTETLGPINDDQKNALAVSQRSAEKLNQLLDDLISFGMAARGELSLQLKVASLPELAKNALGLSQEKASERKISLISEIDTSLLSVRVDEQKFSWVLIQLLDNAIKFTPPGGAVTLSVQREKESGKMARVAISDTGIGIPVNRLEEIFEPFYQLDGASTRRYSGTGLGLALAKQIVEAHGTVLKVFSQIDAGTTITFQLVLEENGKPK